MYRGWKIIGWIALGALFFVLLGWVTMSLWNWLIPSLFAGPVINYWQALGLLLLSKILFSGGRSWHSGRCNHRGSWKSGLYAKFANMSPEEREAFKRKMKEKCSYYQKDTTDPKADSSND